jgi:glycerol uptake facilitator-like aquaporin
LKQQQTISESTIVKAPNGLELARKLTAEALGTAFLIIAVVGSGIMAQRLSPDDVGLQLLENAAATAGALIGLILMLGPVSGAHFNPVVTLSFRYFNQLTNRETIGFIGAQIIGGCIGSVLTNVMFELDAINLSTKTRSSGALWLSEVIATVGLLLLIHGVVRSGRGPAVPFAVGAWIGGAYWFTSSTSFANPAVTVARMLSNTFAGIRPASAPMFIVMQLVGLVVALSLVLLLHPVDLSHPNPEP